MKKELLSLAILLQVVVASAHKKSNNAKLTVYKQPSKEMPVVKVISESDRVVVVRSFNEKWSIVTVNNEVGYMRRFQLAQHRRQQRAAAIAKAKTNGKRIAARF